MRKIMTVILIRYFCLLASAQDADRLSNIMAITGMREEEELSEQVMERFESLERHPLMLNTASLSKLLSSGLFSQYQAASLIDYRSTCGDILSIEELSAIDGFGKSFAQTLAPYVSFFSKSLPGAATHRKLDGSATLRGVWKPEPHDLEGSISSRAKLSLDYGTCASAFLSGTLSLQSGRPEPAAGYTFHAAWYGRRHLDKVILGDFNARFGQGLTCWSGFSLGGMAAPSSLYRRQTGLTASGSASGTGLRGAAVSASWGHWALSAFSGLPWVENGIWGSIVSPGANICFLSRYGQISATALVSLDMTLRSGPDLARTGVDARFCIRGVDLFGEVAADLAGMSMAGLAGVVFPIGESHFGMVGRYYPQSYSKELTGAVKSSTYARDEAGLTLSFEMGKLAVSSNLWQKLSTGRRQLKLLVSDEISLGGSWLLKPRLSARSDLRTDVRADVVRTKVPWTHTFRADWLHFIGHAGLVYYESGLQLGGLTAYFRATAFHVDNWDDRIYAYERDAPGNYSMPAYYGRGVAAALNAAWKPGLKRVRLRLYSSLSWKHAIKPGRDPEESVGLKLQCVCDF